MSSISAMISFYNVIVKSTILPTQTSFSNEISETRIRAVYKVYMLTNSQVMDAAVFENAFGACTECSDGKFGCMAFGLSYLD